MLDERLMKEMRSGNIHFGICPTSSLETGGWDFKAYEEQMFKYGLR